MKKTFKRLLSCMVALLMVLSISGSVFALEPNAKTSGTLEARPTATYDLSGIRNGHKFDITNETVDDEIADDQIVTIMVQLSDAPAMEAYSTYKAAESYAASLRQKQDVAVKDLRKALNADVKVLYNYSLLFNGFSFEGEYRLVEEINKMEGYTAFVAAKWDCPEIQLFNSGDMVGAINAWDLDYTGEGRAVAIVDTGVMVEHPAFSTQPDPDTVKYTEDDIAAIIAGGQLQGTGTSTMNVGKVHYSDKIPFRWNYVHRDYNIAHTYNDHGTHVAGIAAGNGGEIVGIAKDAQIVGMQVFADSGGAGWEAIMAALEDCVVLGVDAANLSLGSPCGFTHYYSPSYAQTFENLVNAGVNLSMSAGNEYSTALGNGWASSSTSIGYALVEDPDYGVTGSPASWPLSLSVAAVDNSKSNSFYLQNVETESMYTYTENGDNVVKLVPTFGGETLPFVAVPGYGAPEDYEGVDVAGKVAVVSRGDITFVEKGQNAQAAGAIACIIYNNVEGSINMVSDPSIEIPFVFVLKTSGDEMAAQGEGQIYVATEQAIMDVPGGGQPSDFSSWGTTSDLWIKPEITAPGGNIYSSTCPQFSTVLYESWSGTSMSAPHVAGGMAIVSEYVDDMFPELSQAERQNLVDVILMSTANPVDDADGSFASVRKQGAGMMDLAGAVSTTSYITVPGCARPKLELGDDPERTGVYEMTFVVNNFGDYELVYAIDPYILMDDAAAIAYDPNGDFIIARTQTSWDITDYCDIDMPEEIVVPANGTAEVTIKVTLSDAIAAYIDTYYPVGNYIEGFIELDGQGGYTGDVNNDGQLTTADALAIMRYVLGIAELENPEVADVNNDGNVDMADALLVMRYAMGISTDFVMSGNIPGEDLNVPFLAFYGDWNYVPMFDNGFYYDDFSYGSTPVDNFIGASYGAQSLGLGINPYVDTDDFSYYMEDRNAISPNDDGFLDTVDMIRLGLMRNASEAGYEIIDAEGFEIPLAHQDDVRKSYYSTSNSTFTNLGTDMGMPRWNAAPYGETDIFIRAYAYLSNDGAITTEAFVPGETENMFNEWIVPVYVDMAAPTAEVVSFANGVLTLDVTDEHYVAYVGAWDAQIVNDEVVLNSRYDEVGLFETERGVVTRVTLNGVSAGALICLADYAGNEIAFDFDGTALTPAPVDSWSHGGVSVPDVTFYAYGKNLTSLTWVKFTSTDMDNLYYGGGIRSDDSDYTCGTYSGEYIYGVSANNELIRYDAEDLDGWTNKTTIGKITGADYTFTEMAYDRSTDTLYGVSGAFDLYAINVQTAVATFVCESEYGIVAIDFDKDGTCYIVDAFGYLCTMDVETGIETTEIGYYGVDPIDLNTGSFFLQCGTFRDGYFFWMEADVNITMYNQMHIYAIKVSTGEFADLGSVMDGLYPLCLFAYSVELPEASVEPVDFYENFEGAFNWETVDADGDGMTWEVKYWSNGLYYDGSKAAVSYSWLDVILYPDNWMISPEFEIGEGEKYLSFFTASANTGAGADIDEHYQVLVIPEGMDYTDGIVVYEKTMDTAAITEHLIDLSDFAGETVRLAFRHFDCHDEYTLIIDAIGVGDLK